MPTISGTVVPINGILIAADLHILRSFALKDGYSVFEWLVVVAEVGLVRLLDNVATVLVEEDASESIPVVDVDKEGS